MANLSCGHHELLKGAIHAAIGGLATTALIYNAVSWDERRQRSLAFNCVIYALVCAWEGRQACLHWRSHGH